MTLYIAPIVEGQTEELCLERILHRVWNDVLVAPHRLQVLKPIRGHRSSLARAGHPELEQRVGEAQLELARRLSKDALGRGLVLLLLDADKDCPATLGPALLTRAVAVRSDLDISCVLAKRQLENWFKAAGESLRGVCGLPDDVTTPPDPEDGSGATWLTQQLQRHNPQAKYKKPGDGVKLAAAVDVALCRQNSPSFDKLCRDLGARVTPPGSDSGA